VSNRLLVLSLLAGLLFLFDFWWLRSNVSISEAAVLIDA
jgi:hypothetical protein